MIANKFSCISPSFSQPKTQQHRKYAFCQRPAKQAISIERYAVNLLKNGGLRRLDEKSSEQNSGNR